MEQTPSLMGAHEIRVRLGAVSRQRTFELTRRADFLAPVADLAQGKIWKTVDVELWMSTHGRG
ncbi:DNA-binding protein [Actinoplanes sp. DH11]|uniref:DNA-binding protein n=1 Tax=Actinoplanes sp. DH11 TaxID=2857011 RepID=UPI001E526717|nr:DNA-binding protein [Actinoplanes sp. DH11]